LLTTEERRSYNDATRAQEIASDQGLAMTHRLAKEVVEAATDLRWCDSVVFVFPTWWYSTPAILKGWFDRVLVGGVAFNFPQSATDTSPAIGFGGALNNIKKVGVVTTYGSPSYAVLAMGDNSRGLIGGAFRQICAPGCLLTWNALYDMDFKKQSELDDFLIHVEQQFELF
jgi:putative NADPH-quinone reductase